MTMSLTQSKRKKHSTFDVLVFWFRECAVIESRSMEKGITSLAEDDRLLWLAGVAKALERGI